MNITDLLNDEQVQLTIGLSITGIIVLIIAILIFKSIRKEQKKRKEKDKETDSIRSNNMSLRQEIRQRLIDHVKYISRILVLHPVIPGNTPDDNSLEGRNRAKCLALIIEGLPLDNRSQGIRMAEFLHQLSDHLVHAYGKEEIVHVKIDAHPVILDVESAISVGLMLNELISNALQYAPEPGEKCKVNVFFKERDNKLVISVGDNGIGMKVPYVPKYSFGLQLATSLVKLHKGDLIISSRPGTRVEIILSEYKTAVREVYVTPTRRIY
jgi:two-component sensor histidine kinase